MSEIFNTAPSSVDTWGILDSKFGKFCSISFWSTVCFIFSVTTLFISLQSKLKIRFHWIKSIYRSVYNISGFTQKIFATRIFPSLLGINSVILPSSHFCRGCLSSNINTKSFLLDTGQVFGLRSFWYSLNDVTYSAHHLFQKCSIVFSTCLTHFGKLIWNSS